MFGMPAVDVSEMKTRPRTDSSISTVASSRSRCDSGILDCDTASLEVVDVASAGHLLDKLEVPGMVMSHALVVHPDGSQMWLPVFVPAVPQPCAASPEALKQHAAFLRHEAKKARAAAKEARKMANCLRRRLEATERRQRAKRAASREVRRAGRLSQDISESDETESTASGSDADLSSCFEDDGLLSEFED